jgi:hypothetical protein
MQRWFLHTLAIMKPIGACLLSAIAASGSVAATATESEPSPSPAQAESQRLLVELTAGKACDRLRGQLRALRAADRPVATGTLWIRDCRATVTDQRVTFAITGSGWRWDEPPAEPISPTPARDWRFDLSVVAAGRLTVGYEPGTRTATATFLPDANAVVDITPAAFETRTSGRSEPTAPIYDAVVGAVSVAIAANAPQLADAATNILADGVVARFPLCLGQELVRLGNGAPLAAEAKSTPAIELRRGGLAVFGPEPPGAATVFVRGDRGNAHAALVCERDAEQVAQAYLDGRPLPAIRELASASAGGAATLRVDHPSCPVALIVRNHGPTAQLHWWRPPGPRTPPLTCTEAR